MSKRIMTKGALACAIALSGCTIIPDKIDLQYTHLPGVPHLQGAAQVAVNVQVIDQRPDKSNVGYKKGSNGVEMASITTSEEVAVTLRKAIETELRARGFAVTSDLALVQIAADLTRFYNTHRWGIVKGQAEADLAMTVSVKSKFGVLLYSQHIAVQGIEENTVVMGGENARLALDKALGNGMKSLFNDRAFVAALMSVSPTPRPAFQ